MPLSIENSSFSTFLSVDFGLSSGSGFRYQIGDEQFIITAKHVIYSKDKLLSDLWIKSKNYFGSDSDAFDAQIDLSVDNVLTFDDLDIAIIWLRDKFNYRIESSGVNISIITDEDIKLYEDIRIGSNIFLVGFPSSLTVDNFYDVDRPLLRTGIVAGKNVKDNTFVIDSLAFYGVSGGPILQINHDHGIEVVGIVSRFIPFVTEWKNRHEPNLSRQDFYNSGYAVCIPLDRVLEKIKFVLS